MLRSAHVCRRCCCRSVFGSCVQSACVYYNKRSNTFCTPFLLSVIVRKRMICHGIRDLCCKVISWEHSSKAKIHTKIHYSCPQYAEIMMILAVAKTLKGLVKNFLVKKSWESFKWLLDKLASHIANNFLLTHKEKLSEFLQSKSIHHSLTFSFHSLRKHERK